MTEPIFDPRIQQYLITRAAAGDQEAIEICAARNLPVHMLGDVVWDGYQTLLWDRGPEGEHGWWSASQGEFVYPGDDDLTPLVSGGVLQMPSGEMAEDDPVRLAAYELFNAVAWLLGTYTVANRLTNPKTGVPFLSPVEGLDTPDDVIELFREAIAAREAQGA